MCVCIYLCVSGFYVSSAPEHSARCVPLDDEWREEDSIYPDPSTLHPFLSGGGRERQKLWQNHVHVHEGILKSSCLTLIISGPEYTAERHISVA